MPEIIDQVETIVLVMMENRSFDHMLGHLSIDDPKRPVNGLRTGDMGKYDNDFGNKPYPVYERMADPKLDDDLPHECDEVAVQLRKNAGGEYTMKGFVEAYAASTKTVPNHFADPMGYFPKRLTPITDFFATKFCVCDNWFAPLPTSTQPNRTMAFSGDSRISETKILPINIDNDIFTWMQARDISWRNYYDCLTFFILYPELRNYFFSDNFRHTEHLAADIQNEPAATAPQVIIIEPYYYSARILGSKHPNDNHAPLAVCWGENFLRRIYQDLSSNAERWSKTVMIVYYDEHGGFFDHVPPPKIPYTTTGHKPHSFESLGVRIPGMIVSPFVKPGTVYSGLLDHTSVLQFIAERFAPDKTYSDTVTKRKNQGIQSISAVLNNTDPYPAPAAPTDVLTTHAFLGEELTNLPQTEMDLAFDRAAADLLVEAPVEVAKKYPELYQRNNKIKIEVR